MKKFAGAENHQRHNQQCDRADDESAYERFIHLFAHRIIPPARELLCMKRSPAGQKSLHLGVGAFLEHLFGIAPGDHGLGIRVKKYRVIADGENARKLMGHHNDGRPEAVAQLENEIIELLGAYRVQALPKARRKIKYRGQGPWPGPGLRAFSCRR